MLLHLLEPPFPSTMVKCVRKPNCYSKDRDGASSWRM